MKETYFKLSAFLIMLLTITTWSCEKDTVNIFPATYWVSESSWNDNGEIKTFQTTLLFADETNFMLFNGNNPAFASVSILSGTYRIEGRTITLIPLAVYSSTVPGGCTFAVQSNSLTNQPIVIDGRIHFNGVWEKAGTYKLETE